MPDYNLSSFNLVIPAGQALVYGTSTVTPKPGKYLGVTLTEGSLDQDVLREWFMRSIRPLVGPAAADLLAGLMQDQDAEFLQAALTFRQSLDAQQSS